MAKRARATVTEVAASHSVYVSQPNAVAALIDQSGNHTFTVRRFDGSGSSQIATHAPPHASVASGLHTKVRCYERPRKAPRQVLGGHGGARVPRLVPE
jgi:hypothetical protein